MKHYLSLIRKSDFTDLFKFGYLYIDERSVVTFNGDIASLSQNTEERDQLFARTNQFDYSFTVLLVYFISDLKDGKLNIEEVQNIFALDAEAKREIEISYDARIRIDNPIWPDAVNKLQEQFLIEDAKKGAQNIWKILKIEQPLSAVESIFSLDMLKEIAYEVQNDLRPKDELSFWIYLLRYERHGFFPKNTAGFFMDLVNVYLNTIMKQEQPAEFIEKTGIYQKILEFQELNMVALIERLAETQEGRNFFDKVDDVSNTKTNSFIIAILFLVLRSKFSNGFNLNGGETIKYAQEKFPDEIFYALYLLGIYLGNGHTFECLYDTLPLPIFKPVVAIETPTKDEPIVEEGPKEVPSFPEEHLHTGQNDSQKSLGNLFDGQEDISKNVPTKKVRKLGTTGIKGTKKVHDEKEFYELLSQGYVPEPKYGFLTE